MINRCVWINIRRAVLQRVCAALSCVRQSLFLCGDGPTNLFSAAESDYLSLSNYLQAADISQNIDHKTYQYLGCRNDHQVVGAAGGVQGME